MVRRCCQSACLLVLLLLGTSVGCGVDGPVLSNPPGGDGGLDASTIPDAGVDAGPPCQWEVEEVAPVRVDAPTSLALDSAGEPHVAYYVVDGSPRATQGWLGYARRVGGQWQTTNVEGGPGQYGWVGLYPSLALDGLDRARIAYRDASSNVLKLASWDGNAWLFRLVETYGARPSLALDAQEHAHIAYAHQPNGTDPAELRLAQWDGAVWQFEVLVADGDVQSLSLALDSAGWAHIAFYDASAGRRSLYYGVWDGAGWQADLVDSSSDGAVGPGCRLALDGLQRPHITYLHVSTQQQMHAMLQGASWQLTVVDPTGRPGGSSGLAFDAQDLPVAAYHLTATNTVGLAGFDGTAWLPAASTGLDGGKHLDLAVDSTDGTHVSFVGSNGGSEGLSYARCVVP